MLELHLANKNYSSWSLRPWLIMKALGIPFKETVHYFTANTVAGSFADISPTAKLPLLIDEDQPIWDSLAITEYLAESYPDVWPASKAARAWARSACAEMHAGFNALRNECSMNIGVRIRRNYISAELQRDINRIDQLWTEGLQQFHGPWLAGSTFTAVDAFYAPVAFRFQTYGLTLSSPAREYLSRLLQHPAMLEWQHQALQETVRDESHEADAAQAGPVTHDFRVAPKP